MVFLISTALFAGTFLLQPSAIPSGGQALIAKELADDSLEDYHGTIFGLSSHSQLEYLLFDSIPWGDNASGLTNTGRAYLAREFNIGIRQYIQFDLRPWLRSL